jgi:putative transposase
MGYGRPSGEKIYTSFFSQQKQLTDLRKVAPWIKDVPRHIAVQLLVNLDRAWQRCFSKTSDQPRWKKRSDQLSFTEFDSTAWSLIGNRLHFPKLALIDVVRHRPLEGKPKTCTIKRDGDQWFVSIVCEVEIADPLPRTSSRVGIDRGLSIFSADSEGRLVPGPKFLERTLKRLGRAQRTVARRIKGSKNRDKAKCKVMRIHRKIRRQRDHFLHVESSHYAKSHGVVVLENLNVKGMVQGNLGRGISDAGWSKFAQYLKYKLEWSGGTLLEVPAHYTSQTCAVCGHVDRASRSGDKFRCTQCGHQDHADLNAALNILSRASRSVQPVEGSSPKTPRRSRKFGSLKGPI